MLSTTIYHDIRPANAICSYGASPTASNLDGAEAEIAAQAQQHGDQYKITSAKTNNGMYMTAELYK